MARMDHTDSPHERVHRTPDGRSGCCCREYKCRRAHISSKADSAAPGLLSDELHAVLAGGDTGYSGSDAAQLLCELP